MTQSKKRRTRQSCQGLGIRLGPSRRKRPPCIATFASAHARRMYGANGWRSGGGGIRQGRPAPLSEGSSGARDRRQAS